MLVLSSSLLFQVIHLNNGETVEHRYGFMLVPNIVESWGLSAGFAMWNRWTERGTPWLY